MDNIVKIFTFINNLAAVSTTAVSLIELAQKMNYSGKKPDENMKRFLKNKNLYFALEKNLAILPNEMELLKLISKNLNLELINGNNSLDFENLNFLLFHVKNLKKDKLKIKKIIEKTISEYIMNL